MTGHESYISKNALLHHGIKGQRWGITNGPPYPLDKDISTGKSLKKHNSSQKKGIISDVINKIVPSKPSALTESNRNTILKEVNPHYAEYNKAVDLTAETKSKYSTYSTYAAFDVYNEDGPSYRYLMEKERKLSRRYADYVHELSGYTNNCGYASLNYILKIQGVDGYTAKWDDAGTNHMLNVYNYVGNIAEASVLAPLHATIMVSDSKASNAFDKLKDYAKKHPNSYGFLSLWFADSNIGHSIVFESKNGVLTITDAQHGVSIDNPKDFFDYMDKAYGHHRDISRVLFTDMSKVKPDVENLKKKGYIITDEEAQQEFLDINNKLQADLDEIEGYPKEISEYRSFFTKNGVEFSDRMKNALTEYIRRNYKLDEPYIKDGVIYISVKNPSNGKEVTVLKASSQKDMILTHSYINHIDQNGNDPDSTNEIEHADAESLESLPPVLTEEEYNSIMADLDEMGDMLDSFEQEVKGKKIRHDAFEDEELALIHYASPYYDPVYAHEYYMAHRKLKGRGTSGVDTSNLNTEGLKRAKEIKKEINDERDFHIHEKHNKTKEELKSIKKESIEKRKAKRETLKKDIKYSCSEAKNHISAMREHYNALLKNEKDPNKKAALKQQKLSEIGKLRDARNSAMEKLASAYAADSNLITVGAKIDSNNEKYSFDSFKADKIIEAENDYANVVEDLNSIAKYSKKPKLTINADEYVLRTRKNDRDETPYYKTALAKEYYYNTSNKTGIGIEPGGNFDNERSWIEFKHSDSKTVNNISSAYDFVEKFLNYSYKGGR